ncbi:ck1 family protein kinase [Stylonychia lemnae]|uniref:Casein kinase I n=1 Tax=Stylonychia lemnae TaxID=5949 RepID=A0A078A4T0_STYLE|nr:ck1 family protein kinase [Stylonychia lemnae]|eukprot:CDW75774.1 ck1 family protein kinase [Stylonychia lemnae]
MQFACICQIHKTGFAHLDIKPDNIMLESRDFGLAQSSILHLIDFGVSAKYKEKIFQSNTSLKRDFFGNFAFSSRQQMLGLAPSRKDDIISVLYLLLYLKEGRLPWSDIESQGNLQKTFKMIQKQKCSFHLYLSNKDHNCIIINLFIHQSGLFRQLLKMTDNLQSEDEPDYDYYIQKMIVAFPNSKKGIDWVMDWSRTSIEWYNSYHKYKNYFQTIINSKTKQKRQYEDQKQGLRAISSFAVDQHSNRNLSLTVKNSLEILKLSHNPTPSSSALIKLSNIKCAQGGQINNLNEFSGIFSLKQSQTSSNNLKDLSKSTKQMNKSIRIKNQQPVSLIQTQVTRNELSINNQNLKRTNNILFNQNIPSLIKNDSTNNKPIGQELTSQNLHQFLEEIRDISVDGSLFLWQNLQNSRDKQVPFKFFNCKSLIPLIAEEQSQEQIAENQEADSNQQFNFQEENEFNPKEFDEEFDLIEILRDKYQEYQQCSQVRVNDLKKINMS